MCIERLELAKTILVTHIGEASPAFNLRARDILVRIKERKVALEALVKQKVVAGEEDESIELLPSERDNICKDIVGLGLEPGLLEETKSVCHALDRFHMLAMDGETKETAMLKFEVLGRLAALERRPGFGESPVANEIDVVLSNEWNHLEELKHRANVLASVGEMHGVCV
eukprot:CAMPEP_0170210848 /NCGR_PEP_ID=MMETSP0116_2-20130129/5034_1 /TAXON_ID=400756 /ORGANISM="Durinskia baltica, Strain CSIRO CS-38" /LENGTH=169 /DNA_ID=CAMNT_0010461371 /DNA_START=60 /DNA_END=569 /DNA_ORIENTATION=-